MSAVLAEPAAAAEVAPRRMPRVPAWWPLPLLGAVTLLLCLWQIGTRSLWLDEGASLSIAQQHGAALWSAIAHDGGNMLAYYLGLHLLMAAHSAAITAARLPSALCAVACVVMLTALARRLLTTRGAVIAGLLAAVSLPLVFWAQDIRAYSAMLALVTGSYLAFVRLLEGGGRRAWVAWFACTVLAAYCSFAALLIVPAQLLALSGRRVAWRAALLSVASVALACMPLAVLAAQRGTGQLFWVGRPTIHEVAQTLRWLTSSALQPNFKPSWAAVPLMVSTLALLAGVVVAVLTEARERRMGGLIAVWWVLVPFGLNLCESLAGQPVLLTRNSLVALPGVALALGWLLDGRWMPRAAWLALLGGVIALRLVVLVPTYGVSPENWRAASAYVLGGAAARDCVYFYPQDGRMPFDVYARGDARAARLHPVLPTAGWSTVRPFVESYRSPSGVHLDRTLSGCPRLWLVVSHAGQRRGPAQSRVNLQRYLNLRRFLHGRGWRLVRARSFGYAASVDVTLLGS